MEFEGSRPESNACGHLTTVESARFRREDPAPEEVLAAAGLSGQVSFDRSFSTFTWFLKEQIQQRADASGNCEPLYDFCFLDGQKNWMVDGLAVFLIESCSDPAAGCWWTTSAGPTPRAVRAGITGPTSGAPRSRSTPSPTCGPCST
jgi:hypothetical protein